MVELTHNNHRYMVENGQWFRRLEVGGERPKGYEYWSDLQTPPRWMLGPGEMVGLVLMDDEIGCDTDYRVPCTEPRPPFVVGQRVKVARKDESFPGWAADMDKRIGTEGEVAEITENNRYRVTLGVGDRGWFFPSWCLDAVTEDAE